MQGKVTSRLWTRARVLRMRPQPRRGWSSRRAGGPGSFCPTRGHEAQALRLGALRGALLLAVLCVLVFSACSDITPPESSPTPEGPSLQARSTLAPRTTATPTPVAPAASPTSPPTPRPEPQTATPTARPSPTPVPPTPTATPSPSPVPPTATPTPRAFPSPFPTPPPTAAPSYWLEAWFEPAEVAPGQPHRLCYELNHSGSPGGTAPTHSIRIWQEGVMLAEFVNSSRGTCYSSVAPSVRGWYPLDLEAVIGRVVVARRTVWLVVSGP